MYPPVGLIPETIGKQIVWHDLNIFWVIILLVKILTVKVRGVKVSINKFDLGSYSLLL